MGKRISKKAREEAALILQLAASNNLEWGTATAAYHLGLGTEPVWDRGLKSRGKHDKLVRAAFNAAASHPGSRRYIPTDDGEVDVQDWVGQCAEAEAMLRTGWTP